MRRIKGTNRANRQMGSSIKVPKRLPDIVIYTDGGSKPNPGRGGYGILIYLKDHDVIELSKGFRYTTNNRMEIMAVIAALEYVEERGIDGDIVIHSDSQHVIQAINGWVFNWLRQGWRKRDGGIVANVDLWKRYTKVWGLRKDRGSTISGNWVKGHVGLPQNEKCDELASIAMCSDELIEDEGYTAGGSDRDLERHPESKYSYRSDSSKDYRYRVKSLNNHASIECKYKDYRDRYRAL